MTTHALDNPAYCRNLSDGLALRWSTAADADGLYRLYSHVFRDNAESPLNTDIAAYADDCLSGRHPLIGPGDFALVEDTRNGTIVSATSLLAQSWEYEDITFGVGRPEVVATDPEYRNRGLVRAIFELIHARSTARGHLVQAITGIRYYYRQFGYEYALDLGGNRTVFFAAIPELKDGETEPYQLREASVNDVPDLLALYDRDRARGAISARVDADYWRWVIGGQSDTAGEGWRTLLIADAAGRTLGYVLPRRRRWGSRMGVVGFALAPGISFLAVLPSVLRGLQAHAERTPAYKPDAPPADRLVFGLEAAHPAYDVLGGLGATYQPPYAWYVRVPDLPAFMRHIAPVLDRRLIDSPAAGHTGELKLNFFREGLRLRFDAGRLVESEPWRAEVWGPPAQASFPPLVFLQLLFGWRSLADLRYAFPDVGVESDADAVLLEALFPAQASWVLPLE
jgi:hypothetical protein